METTYPTGSEGAVVGGIFAFLAGIWIVLILIAVALFVLWIVMLVHALKLSDESFKQIGSGERSIWLIVLGVSFFLGFNGIASLVYYFVVFRKAKSLNLNG